MNTEKISTIDDTDDWFNDFDEISLEIINQSGATKELVDKVTNEDNDTIIDECECIYVEDIIAKDLSVLNAIDIIQYQFSLSHFIKAMIENTNKTFYNSDNNVENENEKKDTNISGHSITEKIDANVTQMKFGKLRSMKYINHLPDNSGNSGNEVQFIGPVTLPPLCPDFQIHTKNADKLMSLDRLNDIIIYLAWISSACEVLAKRIGQEIIKMDFGSDLKVDLTDTPSIIRSSYNFCVKSTQCKNFYNKNEFPVCKNHHYVHSLLKYDIDSIIVFLRYIANNNLDLTIDQLNNIYLSIKTICFVTRNMHREIYYIHYITKNNSEPYHRNNPIDMHKKITHLKQDKYNSTKGGFTQYGQSYGYNNQSYSPKSASTYKPRQFIQDENNKHTYSTFSIDNSSPSDNKLDIETEPTKILNQVPQHISTGNIPSIPSSQSSQSNIEEFVPYKGSFYRSVPSKTMTIASNYKSDTESLSDDFNYTPSGAESTLTEVGYANQKNKSKKTKKSTKLIKPTSNTTQVKLEVHNSNMYEVLNKC